MTLNSQIPGDRQNCSACAKISSEISPGLSLNINPQTGDYRHGASSDHPGFHTLRLLAVGSLYAVNNCRDSLHALGYARPDEWSQPIPLAGHSGIIRGLTPTDIMRILTKRIPLPR